MMDASQLQLTQSPYPGLRPFYRDESEIFFGRDEQVDELLVRLDRHRFLGIVGTSGCGKSSLIKAGLLPALDAGFMASVGSDWRIADLRPGDKPLSSLAQALINSGVLGKNSPAQRPTASDVAATLRRGPLGVVELLNQTKLPEYTNLLILADQFEEIFRYRDRGDPNEALAFVNLLLATASHPGIPAYVVLTMRSDFLGECTVFPGLPEMLNESQFLCPRLNRQQCREAIEGPAAVCHAEVEPKLVNRILNDIGTDPDQLPLMQHALMRLWTIATEQKKAVSDAVKLTLDAYDELGGLRHALSRHADEAYQELASTGKAHLVEQLFRSLSERSADGRAIRREVSVEDVAELAKVPPQDVIEVANHFRRPDRSFITPPADKELEAGTILDVSHESLIRQWNRMRDWVQTEAESAARYRRLIDSARLKQEGVGNWLSGLELQNVQHWWKAEQPTETETWAKRYGGHLDTCRTFLDKSVEHAEESKMQKTAIVTFAFIVVLAMAIYANWQRKVAVDSLEKERLANIENTAAFVMSQLGGKEDNPAQHEYTALADLAGRDEAVQLVFLRQILEDKTKSKRLRSRLPYILHAIVGLNRQMRDKVKSLLIQNGSKPDEHREINIAFAELGAMLHIDEPDVVKMIAANYLAAIEKTNDPDALSSLGSALGSLGEKLPAEQAAAIAQQIVAAMEKTTDPYDLSYLGSALGSLGEQLPAEQAADLAQQIVAAMENTTDGFALLYLGYALGSLGEQLPAEQAAAGAQQIVAAMEKTTDPAALYDLGRALGSLGEQLPAEQAAALAQQIVAAMEKTTDAEALSYLGSALGSLGEQLPAEQAADLAQQIVAAMEKTTNPNALSSLGRALGSLGERLSAANAISILKSLVCVGEVREGMLAALEKKADSQHEFDGNLWKAVDWAEKQGIDVNNVPRWPLAAAN